MFLKVYIFDNLYYKLKFFVLLVFKLYLLVFFNMVVLIMVVGW